VSATAKHPWVFPLPNGNPKYNVAGQSGWTLDQGVDIAAAAHTPLIAVDDGTIVGHGITGFGADAPILKLADGRRVYYGHAGPGNRLPDGTKVHAGDIIGEVGAGRVGISTGPHLEIGYANAAGNPLGRQTAPALKSSLQGSLKLFLPEKGPPQDPISKGIRKVTDAGANAAGDVASAAVKSVFGGFFADVQKQAPRAMLFLLLTIGGLALAGYGTARLFGVQQPVKSTVKAARVAAVVAPK
jgi:hypothetical protein